MDILNITYVEWNGLYYGSKQLIKVFDHTNSETMAKYIAEQVGLNNYKICKRVKKYTVKLPLNLPPNAGNVTQNKEADYFPQSSCDCDYPAFYVYPCVHILTAANDANIEPRHLVLNHFSTNVNGKQFPNIDDY